LSEASEEDSEVVMMAGVAESYIERLLTKTTEGRAASKEAPLASSKAAS